MGEQIGGMEWCLDTAVSYAKIRHQFAAPIGSFQAVQFVCADMYLVIADARSACAFAAWSAETELEDASSTVSIGKAWCSDAYSRVAGDAIQVLGGIGFTWDHDIHLYFKRAASTAIALGTADEHRAVLAKTIGLTT
jgi:alkylation response protein AidB-like acyl-CoA dehydrogenase